MEYFAALIIMFYPALMIYLIFVTEHTRRSFRRIAEALESQ